MGLLDSNGVAKPQPGKPQRGVLALLIIPDGMTDVELVHGVIRSKTAGGIIGGVTVSVPVKPIGTAEILAVFRTLVAQGQLGYLQKNAEGQDEVVVLDMNRLMLKDSQPALDNPSQQGELSDS